MSDTITIDKKGIERLRGLKGSWLIGGAYAVSNGMNCDEYIIPHRQASLVSLDEAIALLRSWGATRIEAEARFDLDLSVAEAKP